MFDRVRGAWVSATPEEMVRQKLLLQMTHQLGFPKEMIAVEKELGQLPIALAREAPLRRVDVLCFCKDEATLSLSPLLLIECKQVLMNHKCADQVLGYNHFVQAPFVGITGEGQFMLFSPQGKHLADFLPSYQELLRAR